MNGKDLKLKGVLGIIVCMVMLVASVPVGAATVGMFVSHDESGIYTFDAGEDRLLHPHPLIIPYAAGLYDCAVTRDQLRGYVSDFTNKKVWIIDLSDAALPRLLGGIQVPIEAIDLALSADETKLLVTDGGFNRSVVTIDLATGAVAQSGGSYQSVEVCADNSVLATQCTGGQVVEFGWNEAGDNLVATGSAMAMARPVNTACEPDALAAVAVTNESESMSGYIHAMALPGLPAVGWPQALAEPGIAAVFSPRGDEVFVRSESFVQRFPYNPLTGVLESADMTLSVSHTKCDYGVDKLAVSPDGRKLYVPEDVIGVNVIDAGDGSLLTTIPGRAGRLGGVCLPSMPRITIDIKPGPTVSSLDPAGKGSDPVVLFGAAGLDVADIDQAAVAFAAGTSPVGKSRTKDVNGDGFADLQMSFRHADFGVRPGDGTACLTGRLVDGTPFMGCDAVNVVW